MKSINYATMLIALSLAMASSICQAQRYAYYGGTAGAYGKTFGKSYNTLFPNYASLGGDCDNFVNQCIMAGLLPSSNGNTVAANTYRFTADKGSTYSWYFINANSHSPSWTYAPSLYQYARTNKSNYKGLHFLFVTEDTWTAYLDVSKVQVGDVIFADWTNDGVIDHVMIVTEIQPSQAGYNKIRVAGHTTDMVNSGLGDINVTYNYRATFHVYRPTDYNCSGQ